MAAETNSTDSSTPHLFLHARFELPKPVSAAGGNDVHADDEVGGGDGNLVDGGTTTIVESTESLKITKQSFDASNCKVAILGLPKGVDPTKPEAGDYSYSGMHDHGPLPQPKEGGKFAQIIGLVSAAKKASDAYLTEVIEKEKAIAAASNTDDGGKPEQKRKRK